MNIIKKLLIYLGIAFLVLMMMLDSFVITYGDFSFVYLTRILVWALLIALLLYFDGKLFAKKAEEDIKYTKTKSNIILIVTSVVVLLIFSLAIFQ